MELQRWKERLLPYEYAVEELKVKFKNIRKEFVDGEEYTPIEFITGRVKKVSSIMDKAKRLRIGLDEMEEKIEDIAGIRIMCPFIEDIYMVVNYIRSRQDMKVVMEKDYIAAPKKSGYRSYHLIIRYPIHSVSGMVEVPVEIQIRTLSMNFWATIEHSLRYKYDQYLPEEIAERLKKAADSAFHLDNEMGIVRREIMNAQIMFEMKSITVQDIIRSIQELKKMGRKDEAEEFQKMFNDVRRVSRMDEIISIRDALSRRIYQLDMERNS